MISKYKKLSGGYRFKNFEGQPEEKLIQAGIPQKVIIPLKQGFSNEILPLVKIGDHVKAGQIIARNDKSVSSPIHSTINGTVEAIKKINYFNKEVNAVIIESNGLSEWQSLEGHSSRWTELPTEKIEELLYLSGVTSLDREGIPTCYKSSNIFPEEVKNIVIRCVDFDVYNLSLTVLLEGKKISNFAEGLKILKAIMPNARIHLAFDKNHRDLIEHIPEWIEFYPEKPENHPAKAGWMSVLKRQTRSRLSLQGGNGSSGFRPSSRGELSKVPPRRNVGVGLHVLEPKYPQGYDEILIPTILGEKFPYRYSSAVVLNIQTVLQVYDAVTIGKPLIERIIALCGPGFEQRPHIRVRIGTPLEYIIKGNIKEDKELRFIQNSLLTGMNLSDLSLPVDCTFSQIISLPEGRDRKFLAFIDPGFKKDSYSNTFLSIFTKFGKKADTNIHGEARECIFCNFCKEVCPVGIIPHYFYRYVEKGIIDETLVNFKIFDCIDCNLCSYVCPSKIQVAKHIKRGKEELIKQGNK